MSNILDLKDLTFAELFKDYKEHSEIWAPKISRFTNWTKNTPTAILEFSIP